MGNEEKITETKIRKTERTDWFGDKHTSEEKTEKVNGKSTEKGGK